MVVSYLLALGLKRYVSCTGPPKAESYCVHYSKCLKHFTKREGDVAQLVERRTGTPLTLVRFPGAARDFSPRVNFQ